MEEHPFSWFSLLPIIGQQPNHVITAIFVLLLLGGVSLYIRNSLKKMPNPLVPPSRFNLLHLFEVVIEFILGLMEGIIGPHSERYLPLIGSLFIFIFTCNILGIIPGFLPPTDNINTNAACAIIVFLVYNYYGFKEHGWKYIRQFTGPIIWLAPMMFVIEIFSHLFRPFSLSVRLFGNIFGDHMVLQIFSDLVPFLVPCIFMVLGMVVSLIQAFIFAALATVYIGLAVSHEH
jgi:F-type H+-transporting ATPase subunit a